ncbi:uncharacterized protein BDZ99DRAFT_479305 [Mytilinidion resinicola]|uniref:Uncharacterized protein n=1 Tax=Mytilinidion resinicola TaxID=574789 RepID=A0A6A6YEB2_9PEZI|nr:uncharacterized protein BDZ99DRAFT_479305 [Mytilinidion resinicola]KAF2806939.1 hypothetical protein BDZ99DRAFT_479305 [Mytilinidion resinicola]
MAVYYAKRQRIVDDLFDADVPPANSPAHSVIVKRNSAIARLPLRNGFDSQRAHRPSTVQSLHTPQNDPLWLEAPSPKRRKTSFRRRASVWVLGPRIDKGKGKAKMEEDFERGRSEPLGNGDPLAVCEQDALFTDNLPRHVRAKSMPDLAQTASKPAVDAPRRYTIAITNFLYDALKKLGFRKETQDQTPPGSFEEHGMAGGLRFDPESSDSIRHDGPSDFWKKKEYQDRPYELCPKYSDELERRSGETMPTNQSRRNSQTSRIESIRSTLSNLANHTNNSNGSTSNAG